MTTSDKFFLNKLYKTNLLRSIFIVNENFIHPDTQVLKYSVSVYDPLIKDIFRKHTYLSSFKIGFKI